MESVSAACDRRVRLAAEQFRRRLTAAESLRRGAGADRDPGILAARRASTGQGRPRCESVAAAARFCDRLRLCRRQRRLTAAEGSGLEADGGAGSGPGTRLGFTADRVALRELDPQARPAGSGEGVCSRGDRAAAAVAKGSQADRDRLRSDLRSNARGTAAEPVQPLLRHGLHPAAGGFSDLRQRAGSNTWCARR